MLPTRDSVKSVAAIHHRGDALALVQASIAGGVLQVTSAQTVPVGGAGPALGSILPADSVDLLVQVIPASRSLVRTAPPPVAPGEDAPSDDALADALALIAESELPSSLPGYRRGAGLLRPGRPGPGAPAGRQTGVLTGWPESAEGSLPVPRVAPVVAVAEPAALAMLAQMVGGVRSAAAVHPALGALAVLAAGDDRTVLRAVRLPETDVAPAAEAVVDEACAAAGVPPPRAAEPGAHLALDPAPVSPRLGGAVRDAAWVDRYGLALAAIALYADPSPAVHALAALHEVEPKTRPNPLERLTGWFGAPGRAAAVIGVCALALGLLPIGAAWARGSILERHVPDERAVRDQNAADERELAFYRLLRDKRWPMSRLLADVAGACPVGISLESVDLSQGDSALNLRGTAQNTELLTTFRERLAQTGAFRDVSTPSTSPTSGGVQFQLTAKVPPNVGAVQTKPADDFVARPLAERLYGEAGRNAKSARVTRSYAERADRRARDAAPPSQPSRQGDAGRPGSSAAANARADARGAAPKDAPVIPPPLTDAQIAKLTSDQAMKEWSVRKKAATQAGLDADTKRRLQDESEKAKARMVEARSAGGGK